MNKLLYGDNILLLKGLADNSVDSIVTDPPYGLKFMNKHWDYDVPKIELWRECLRVLKPGGHLLSFAGTRTYHRMTVRIEDAGFEIRDMISWIYGSGFPKSLDVSKAIMKIKGDEGNVVGTEVIDKGIQSGSMHAGRKSVREVREATTPEAIQGNGWGTALKPACEPICVARKPVNGTIAENVLQYGTGGLNIDGCRIGLNGEAAPGGSAKRVFNSNKFTDEKIYGDNNKTPESGRYPANIIFDEDAALMLDEQTKNLQDSKGKYPRKNGENQFFGSLGDGLINTPNGINDKGGASRFFYCAKASKAERNGGLEGFEEKRPDTRTDKAKGTFVEKGVGLQSNHHPTVKPLRLMRYLVKLVTPPNGLCLDPYAGSGTTLMACVMEGFNFLGMEREEEYMKIAEARIEWAKKRKAEEEKEKGNQVEMFEKK